MKNLKKIGIIGCGFLVRAAVLKALLKGNDFEVRVIFDPDSKQLEQLHDLPGYCLLIDSEEKFWESDLDAVYVATPNVFHVPYAIKALERNIAVIIEKPLAASLEQGKSLVNAASKSAAPSMIGYMSKFNSYNVEALDLLKKGAIGKLRSMVATFQITGTGNMLAQKWRSNPKMAGSGALGDLGIYPVTTAIDIFQEFPTGCFATAYPVGKLDMTDCYFSGRLQFSGGKYLNFDVSFVNENPKDRGRVSYTMVGDNGLLIVERSWAMDGNGKLVIWRNGRQEQKFPTPRDPYVEEFQMLAKAIDGEKVPLFATVRRGYDDLLVMDALMRSAREKKSIQMEKNLC